MKTYQVVITENAKAIRNDAAETKKRLEKIAGSLKPLENPKMRGYRKIHFLKHDYVMLYRIENDIVYVDRIYHELQDYENSFN